MVGASLDPGQSGLPPIILEVGVLERGSLGGLDHHEADRLYVIGLEWVPDSSPLFVSHHVERVPHDRSGVVV